MSRLTPLAEAGAGVGLASWVGLGSSIAILQTVIGPDAAMGVGLVVNIAFLFGAAGLIFHAGTTFKGWREEVARANELAEKLAKLERRQELTDAELAAYQRVLSMMHVPKEDDDG